MKESWRPIAGRDGYEVSDLGRVRSIDRVVTAVRGGPRRYRARVLRPCRTRNGYCTVKVGGRSVYVHRLVLEAFVGPRPPGHQAAHWNGNKRENVLWNLRWASRQENEADKLRHGTLLTGARTPNGRKTRCPQGHPYDSENTMLHRGRRSCRTCRRDETRRRRQAMRARQAEEARRSGTHG